MVHNGTPFRGRDSNNAQRVQDQSGANYSPGELKWTKQRVRRILTSTRYIGTTVYNRASNKLGEGTIFNPSAQWVCRESAVKPLVEPQVFLEAQNIVQRRLFRPDNYQILDQLSALLKRTGKISERIISKEKDLPCMAVIMRHFKSLLVVYELIGYKPLRDFDGIASMRQDRISKHGVKSMGEGIRVAVASGQLSETFPLSELKPFVQGGPLNPTLHSLHTVWQEMKEIPSSLSAWAVANIRLSKRYLDGVLKLIGECDS